jgi:hypothetical protein
MTLINYSVSMCALMRFRGLVRKFLLIIKIDQSQKYCFSLKGIVSQDEYFEGSKNQISTYLL